MQYIEIDRRRLTNRNVDADSTFRYKTVFKWNIYKYIDLE